MAAGVVNTASLSGDQRLCPVCLKDNKDRKKLRYSRDRWVLKKCRACDFVYLENPPQYEELSETYAWEKTSRIVKESKEKSKSWLRIGITNLEKWKDRHIKRDKLFKLVPRYFKAGKIIDIGCGGGAVIGRLDKKFIPFGVEISKQLAHDAHMIAEARGGKVIHNNSIDSLASFSHGYFEGAIMSAFLEHELHPAEALAGTFAVLKNGCSLIIKVPNYACLNRTVMGKNWCGFRFPDHLNYYTPSSLQKSVMHAGFEIIKFNIFDKFPTSDNMWMVARKPA